MDDIAERCREYKRLGCDFAKWRMVIDISDTKPSKVAVTEGVRSLGLYAAVCQANGLVPIVEPDFNRQGVHTIERMQVRLEKRNGHSRLASWKLAQ